MIKNHGLFLPRLFFTTHDDVGGGAPQKTLKDQLTDANARIAELEPKSKLADSLQLQLTGEQGKVMALEGEKTQLTGQVTALEGEKTNLTAQVTALEGEKMKFAANVTKLEGDVTAINTRLTKIKEKAAAHGITGLETEAAQNEAKTGDASNGESLYEEYSKLQGRAKTAFFAKNEKALLAYAESPSAGK